MFTIIDMNVMWRSIVNTINYKVLDMWRAVNIYNYKGLKLRRAVNVQNVGDVESSECL